MNIIQKTRPYYSLAARDEWCYRLYEPSTEHQRYREQEQRNRQRYPKWYLRAADYYHKLGISPPWMDKTCLFFKKQAL